MKILAVSDEESKYLWDFYEAGKLDGIDLILSAGDLAPEYLSFLVTMGGMPVLYVHGNHDAKYEMKPPEGCVCIDDDLYVINGIRILGLGGSMMYNGRGFQYTEKEMRKRIRKLWFKLFCHKGFDILLTHSPAYKMNDAEDQAHRGFECFVKLLDKYKPKYFIHGHVHKSYGRAHIRYDRYNETNVINAFERCVFEFEDNEETLRANLK
ncbi:MAG: metallophosphoesterase [Lachnospiraceae bacterium]|nr:metallophosphoesterase [Lachnospiraceae bacterium]